MNVAQIRSSLIESLATDVDVGEAGPKVYCALPLEYPTGDAVVVYLDERPEGIDVSDYGMGWETAVRSNARSGRVKEAGETIANDLGVSLLKGRMTALARPGNLAEVVWRVGMASARLGDAPTFQAAEALPRESDFVATVDGELSPRTPLERHTEVEGTSGHLYTATFYIPETHTVIEPWTPMSGWNRATALYAQFGDLANANGYKRFAVLDDRSDQPGEQVIQLAPASLRPRSLDSAYHFPVSIRTR